MQLDSKVLFRSTGNYRGRENDEVKEFIQALKTNKPHTNTLFLKYMFHAQ